MPVDAAAATAVNATPPPRDRAAGREPKTTVSVLETTPRPLVADWSTLQRIFLKPENDAARSALLKYMEQILFGLHDFLKTHVGITREASLRDLAARFTDVTIAEHPEKKLAGIISELIEEIAPHAVNVASPYFVGHMTAAIPFFMVHLKTIVAALNQNVVKLETSKVVSVLEKQVLAKLHRLIFGLSDDFYATYVQNPDTCLGTFVEDGTLANLTALWVARNRLLGPLPGFSGIEAEGLPAAMEAHGVRRVVVLASRLAHHSLRKAGGVLGIGSANVLGLPVDARNRVDLRALQGILKDLQKDGTRVMALVGIAGTTEAGTIDPLTQLAEIAAERGIHFHVDAAWGGATLMSPAYRHLLQGIERADSVTIDGHKQFYMPMSCGMVYFRDPHYMDAVAYHARYINRPGSVDLGIRSLCGSREAASLILHSALKIMGSQGYALLIDHGIQTARAFAEEIRRRPDFELLSAPELNIVLYRLRPRDPSPGGLSRSDLNQRLNRINIRIQRLQREAGKSFVSRTTVFDPTEPEQPIVALRCVLMNPMTTMAILHEILDEQTDIYQRQVAAVDG